MCCRAPTRAPWPTQSPFWKSKLVFFKTTSRLFLKEKGRLPATLWWHEGVEGSRQHKHIQLRIPMRYCRQQWAGQKIDMPQHCNGLWWSVLPPHLSPSPPPGLGRALARLVRARSRRVLFRSSPAPRRLRRSAPWPEGRGVSPSRRWFWRGRRGWHSAQCSPHWAPCHTHTHM